MQKHDGESKEKQVSLQLQVDLEFRDELGRTALLNAAQNGDLNVLDKEIRAKKAQRRARNMGGCTALYLAAASGHTRIVKELNPVGADIWTPLQLPVRKGQTETDRELQALRAVTEERN